jgi:hypothetical protein
LLRILLDDGHLAGERAEPSGRHSVPQEVHLRDGEGTLLKVDDQPGFLEEGENLSHISLVLSMDGLAMMILLRSAGCIGI